MLGLYWDNGKENGNYYSMLGLYWDNGKENGNYYSILGLYWGYTGTMEKKMETTIMGDIGVRLRGLGSKTWGLEEVWGVRAFGFRV